jgi:hypothetical protein
LEKPRKSFDLPWPAIAAALVAVGGVFVYLNPLQTSRPAERTGPHLNFNHLQDVDARLWQDPLRTTAEHERTVQEQKRAGTDVSVEDSLHSVNTLRQKLNPPSSSDYWVLAVMIPGGSYAEYSEARLRTRQAVLEALGAENYGPDDGEHIGYVKISREDWNWRNVIIPFEWCRRSAAHHVSAKNFPDRVCLVWLPEEEFRDAPLSQLDWLLRDPAALGISTANIRTRIIGPPTSTTLLAMMREVDEDEQWRGCLPAVEMWCATATASDELLLYEINGGGAYQTVEEYFTTKMAPAGVGESFVFNRCTATDRDVINTLADELRTKRGLRLNRKDNDDHIALISEWDTFYGRALPVTFECEVSTMPLDQLMKGDHPRNILSYHYLRGIDGMLPGTSVAEAAKTEEKNKTDEKKQQSSLAREMTEGLNQADYLRRLARALVNENEKFRRRREPEIKAVGVLGSDVYDKLLVMEALRNALPNAIFFTTPLDARLTHPDEWRWTRNLLVGSPFGLSLREKYQDVPPFRESNQTACYTATLLAAGNPGRQKFLKNKDVLYPVRLYEIGRKGAFDLTPASTSTNLKTLQPANFDMMRWWNLPRAILTLVIVLCAIDAIAWSVFVILRHPKQNKSPEHAHSSFARVLGSSWSIFVILGLCSVVLVWTISCYNPPEGEPYSWNDGISVWPTETLRLLAALLSVFYIWRVSTKLWQNEQEVESHFALPKYHESPELWQSVRTIQSPPEKGWWSRLIAPVTVRHWKCNKDNTIDAEQLWACYCASGAQSARWLRIGPLIVCYVVAATYLLILLGAAGVPARGDWARHWDSIFLFLAILGSVSLTFYVADVMLLSRRFIHYLMKNVTTWPDAAVGNLRGLWSRSDAKDATKEDKKDKKDKKGKKDKKAKEDIPPIDLLREYLDIDFIARATEFVGGLIYYPFIVISLLIISRSGVFDRWTWPVALLIIVGFNVGYAVFSVVYLRRTAENARKRSLKRLHDMLMAYTATGRGKEKEANTVREATTLIENDNRGAFAAISQQPLAAALLLPSGSAGIWALLQLFPRLFSG